MGFWGKIFSRKKAIFESTSQDSFFHEDRPSPAPNVPFDPVVGGTANFRGANLDGAYFGERVLAEVIDPEFVASATLPALTVVKERGKVEVVDEDELFPSNVLMSLEARKIKNLKVGQSVYVTPWSLDILPDRTVWINGDQRGESYPGGTVSTKITRTDAGYEVEATRDHEYHIKDTTSYRIRAVKFKLTDAHDSFQRRY